MYSVLINGVEAENFTNINITTMINTISSARISLVSKDILPYNLYNTVVIKSGDFVLFNGIIGDMSVSYSDGVVYKYNITCYDRLYLLKRRVINTNYNLTINEYYDMICSEIDIINNIYVSDDFNMPIYSNGKTYWDLLKMVSDYSLISFFYDSNTNSLYNIASYNKNINLNIDTYNIQYDDGFINSILVKNFK